MLVSALAKSAVTFVHTDHLGSVVAESNSNGTITRRFHYKPFGETIEAQQDDIGYTGHKHDVDIGLTYMQARYYDPVLGRFYANDPVEFQGHLTRGNSAAHGFTRYAYANNNPYKYVDPDGEIGILASMAIGAAASMIVDAGFQLASNKEFNVGQMLRAGVAGAAGGGLAGVGTAVKALSNISKLDKVGIVSTAGVAASGVSVGVAQVNSVLAGEGGLTATQVAVEAVSAVAPTPGKVAGEALSHVAGTSSRNGVVEAVADDVVSGATSKAVDKPLEDIK